jgi:hypothetical protein
MIFLGGPGPKDHGGLNKVIDPRGLVHFSKKMSDAYHDRVIAHELATTCPDEFINSGVPLENCRKPDSTWYSSVGVYRERMTLGTDGTGDAAGFFVSRRLTSDVYPQSGGSTINGLTNPISIAPQDLRDQTFYYRIIGCTVKITPVTALDTRAGEIGILNFIPPVNNAPTNLAAVRDYPWGWTGPYPAGAHGDMGHAKHGLTIRLEVQGGDSGTTYNSDFPMTYYWDPDMFHLHQGTSNLINGVVSSSAATYNLPNSAAASQNFFDYELQDNMYVRLEGLGLAAVAGTTCATVDFLKIVEICVPSQLFPTKPITAPSRPSTQAGRKKANGRDLEYIANKGAGALGWLGKNWRGIAKGVVDVVNVGTTLGSMASIPGMGAIDAAVDVIDSFL